VGTLDLKHEGERGFFRGECGEGLRACKLKGLKRAASVCLEGRAGGDRGRGVCRCRDNGSALAGLQILSGVRTQDAPNSQYLSSLPVAIPQVDMGTTITFVKSVMYQ
jgi:hypothetical protein